MVICSSLLCLPWLYIFELATVLQALPCLHCAILHITFLLMLILLRKSSLPSLPSICTPDSICMCIFSCPPRPTSSLQHLNNTHFHLSCTSTPSSLCHPLGPGLASQGTTMMTRTQHTLFLPLHLSGPPPCTAVQNEPDMVHHVYHRPVQSDIHGPIILAQ
jgi:hypothetical protein